MCDACVIDTVKRTMLSRRGLLGLGAAAAAASALPGPLRAQEAAAPHAAGTAPTVSGTRLHDLTHTLTEDFPTFFGEQQFFMEKKFSFDPDGFNLFELRVNEHTGTHVDAPLHFSADGLSVDELPVEDLLAPLVVVDIRERAEGDADAQLTPDDIEAWIAANGDLPERCVVALHSGWAAHLGTDRFRNVDGEGKMHFPGFHPEAAAMLLEGSTVGIASDTLSLDNGPSPDFAVHYAWLPAGRWGIECIAGLEGLPATGATIILGAPKHAGGTGGPARAFALL